MLILLSPAKNLDLSPPPAGLPRSTPALLADARALARTARKLSAADLKRLMDVSDKIAELTAARFKAFDADPETGKQAALLFNGDVYQGLQAKSLSFEDLAWAQGRVRILSGLYGLLRPLDAIGAYRLEMGTKLATTRGEDLYDFWRKPIAKALNAELAAEAAPVLINLASDEYAGAIDRKAIKARIVTPKFLDVKDGKARPVFLFVKRARGLMARHLVEARAQGAGDLFSFTAGGYAYDADASTEDAPVFTRPQPPPVARAGKS